MGIPALGLIANHARHSSKLEVSPTHHTPVRRSSGPPFMQPPILRPIASFVDPRFELWCKPAAFFAGVLPRAERAQRFPSLGPP